MDAYIDSRFERLEKALATLIDSVTKYHPSPIQAEELKNADNELCKGLEQVEVHQKNHLKIQQLRQMSTSLDAQIRETLTSLATTRKDLVTTQVTTYPSEPNYPVLYEELLGFARRISKTSMPPAAILNAMAANQESQTPVPDSQQTQMAMTPSSAQTPNNPMQSPAPTNGVAEQQQQQTQASAHTSLPDNMNQFLNPLSGQLFFPWPLEDKIRSGALASNQILLEQGIDPRGYDPVAEEERKRKEEEERKEREEKEKQERAEREREAERQRQERQRAIEKQQAEWRRASIAAGASGEAGVGGPPSAKAEKKQFQFTNLDDLDDDDDED
ncbi:Mediator of RNA polymerase II transcription subunit 4 [Trichoderma ghanense]|uniref:Mediator of RNA polymerase II transcription subunit 4 n=1 Tax=Trichoderma ghanense TaxID=65468 RepID=A0ABY2GXP6_9HYPO